MTKAAKLREYLSRDGITVSVGCYDGFTAKLIEQAGFELTFMSGAGVATSLRGLPDNGLLTMPEMAEAAKSIAMSVDIPVIADADNGFGNAMNVRRAVMEFEMGGCAAIQLEDQVMPKRCGHMDGKEVISCEENCRKIELAAKTRKEMLILGRTDAGSLYGIDEAIRRSNEYAKAGADMILIDAPRTVEEMKKIGAEVKAPVMINLVEGGKTPFLPKEELQQMGFKIVNYPGVCILTVIHTLQLVLAELRDNGTCAKYASFIGKLKDHNDLVDIDFYKELERVYIHGER